MAAPCAPTQNTASTFFFQAEDGIRDLTVTGVQTCALPIFTPAPLPFGRGVTHSPFSAPRRLPPSPRPSWRGRRGRGTRSEERRVGKECRSRWSADYVKRNAGLWYAGYRRPPRAAYTVHCRM